MATITGDLTSYDDDYSAYSVSGLSLGADGSSSSDYATINLTRGSGAETSIYYNFSLDIPEGATINSVSCTAKCYISTTNSNRVSTRTVQLYSGTTAKGSTHTVSNSTSEFSMTAGTWTATELNSAKLRIHAIRGSSNTNTNYYFRFYGATITVEYTLVSRTITSTLIGNGTIDPNGAFSIGEGEEYELTITPTTKSDTVTITKDGTDVSSQLVAHGTESSVSLTPNDVTTSSISNGSSYAEYAVGNSAEDPSSSGSSSNMYSSSGSTGYAAYSFDFSAIPNSATIEEIVVRCYGHRESSTIDSSHVSNVALYYGSTMRGEDVDFPSTSNSIVTIDNTGTWTRAELSSLTLRHTVGYYGGLVLGITLEVTYSTGSGIDHYTYTYTVSGDSTIIVTIGDSVEPTGDTIYIKVNGTWKLASKIYVKVNNTWKEVDKVYLKSSSSWSLTSDKSAMFSSSAIYINGGNT